MAIPSRPIGQDPQSQMLWYIAKELEQIKGLMGALVNQGTTTTTTTTAVPTTTTSTTTTTTTTVGP